MNKTQLIALTSMLSLVAPFAAHADEMNGTAIVPSTGTTPAPVRRSRRHRRHKKTTADSTTPGMGADPKAAPGISDNLKGNDAGRHNMQSPDHVPGTTGTSGQ